LQQNNNLYTIDDLMRSVDEYKKNKPLYDVYIRPIFITVDTFIKNIKFFIKRIQVGFDIRDTWDLDYSISKFILPRLKYFHSHLNGYPDCLQSEDEWYNIVDKMIKSFETILHNDGFYNIDKTSIIDFDKVRNMYEEKQREVDEGLALFAKYFQNLWN
jgi:hypothetical protein